jgi:hypothetical protein
MGPNSLEIRWTSFTANAYSCLTLVNSQIIFFTFAGGAVGFYYQDKLLKSDKQTLMEAVPALEISLREHERRRSDLEVELRNAEEASRAK